MFKKLAITACLAAAVSLAPGAAMAENIKGKLGVTGRLGFLIPADNEAEYDRFRTNDTDLGGTGGVGVIYGIDNNWAGVFEISSSSFDSDTGDFELTNLSFGMQYRVRVPDPRQLVPYAGAGIDFIFPDYGPYDGTHRSVDTAFGIHLTGGADYFLTGNLAFTAEVKAILGPDSDITAAGRRTGDFDPSSLSTTAGLRYYFQ